MILYLQIKYKWQIAFSSVLDKRASPVCTFPLPSETLICLWWSHSTQAFLLTKDLQATAIASGVSPYLTFCAVISNRGLREKKEGPGRGFLPSMHRLWHFGRSLGSPETQFLYLKMGVIIVQTLPSLRTTSKSLHRWEYHPQDKQGNNVC